MIYLDDTEIQCFTMVTLKFLEVSFDIYYARIIMNQYFVGSNIDN